MICGLFSCSNSSQQNKKPVSKDETTEAKKADTVTVGIKIQGDFDGDGQTESAFDTKTKEGKGNPIEDGTSDEYTINFSTEKLRSINLGCCNSRLINEGDLNNDGADEISVFQAPMNGCTYTMTTYSFDSNNWEEIIETFLIVTACEPISDEDLQKRIFKEDKTVYYYDSDTNDENSKLVRKKATINL